MRPRNRTFQWIAYIRPGCWLCDTEGDPGRTLVKASASGYDTYHKAQMALAQAMLDNPHRNFDKAGIESREKEDHSGREKSPPAEVQESKS